MRSKNDYTYEEWKENTYGDFLMLEECGWPAEDCSGMIIEEEEENHKDFEFVGTTTFLFLLSVAVREQELGVLEDRVRNAISFHILLYAQGEYREDLAQEEIELVDKDVEYLKKQGVLLSWDQLHELEKKGELIQPQEA